jgi:serine/threonine-protein kinase
VEIGSRIGRYRLRRRLADGRRSVVYEAERREGQRVAIKVFPVNPGEGGRALTKARDELHMAQRFDHPNLRRCHKVIKKREGLRVVAVGLVKELVEGRALQPEDARDLRFLCCLMERAADAVNAMHRAGQVHADLKPDNFLVTRTGDLKIIDFDQSIAIGARKDRVEGTAGFRAPEQVRQQPLDARTDVYGLGATLYYALTARFAPTENPDGTATAWRGAPDAIRPAELVSGLPQALDGLVAHCLRPRAADRPQDMRVARHWLTRVRERIEDA